MKFDPSTPTNPHGTFIIRVLIFIALAALAALMWQLRHLLLLVFGAVLVAVILRSASEPLQRRLNLSQGFALAVTLLLILGVVVAASWLFGTTLAVEARALIASLPAAWDTFEARIGDMAFGERLTRLATDAAPSGSGLLSGAGRVAASLGSSLADLALVLAGGIYLAAQPKLYVSGLLKLLPGERRKLIEEALVDSGNALRLWFKGQLVAMIVVGFLVGGGLWLIGVPLPFVLGLLAGVTNFIPLAGPIIAAIPALLLALTISPNAALMTAGLMLLVQQLEGNVLTPMLQQKAVDLPPVLLLFALLGFGSVFGVLGVILAAPLTVVLYVLVKRLYVREALDTPTSVPGEEKS